MHHLKSALASTLAAATLGAPIAVSAQQYNPVQLDAMKQLAFMTGQWRGTGLAHHGTGPARRVQPVRGDSDEPEQLDPHDRGPRVA